MQFNTYPIKILKNGILGTKKFSIYYNKNGKIISPWNDIPLFNNDNTYNMICEIPKWTRKKMEINTRLENNPITQDLINDKPREYIWGDMLLIMEHYHKHGRIQIILMKKLKLMEIMIH